jgi:hydrogenase maturation protein HypF
MGATLRLKGIVQGVGFRPFIHNLAAEHAVHGYVRNLGDARVELYVEGVRLGVEQFISGLKTRAPPICQVADMEVEYRAFSGRFTEFTIYPSNDHRAASGSVIPPDIAICDQCAEEVLSAAARWHLYPFACCASCGPRFTAVLELPYDRERTNMSRFPMCDICQTEYCSPKDRRFHAQGICCSTCGPHVTLHEKGGHLIDTGNPLKEAARLLAEGAVVGIKGIGGVHVSASVFRDDTLQRIRRRKGRLLQPFAVMSRDLGQVKKFADFSQLESELLEHWRRPIVALRKSDDYALSELVAPHLDTVGVMLPYTGIHLLLCNFSSDPAIVMTSGNMSGQPMAITNADAIRQLSDTVDYLLLHDRDIVARCDDSVIRVLDHVPTIIRRSRGYVPAPIEVPVAAEQDVVAVGAELRSAGALLHGSQGYLTQHVGDVDCLETAIFLEDAVEHLRHLVGVQGHPKAIAHDMHPKYLSTRLAKDLSEKWGATMISVQHHHAHAASLMAENSVPMDQSIVAIAMDGVGFGLDGDIWGGEILVSSYKDFERVGHLARQPMPGGDACTRFPLRMCAGMLREHLEDSEVRSRILSHTGTGNMTEEDLGRLLKQITDGVVLSWTSSAGRVLDAMAAVAGLCRERTYEGEPAMTLEAVAEKGEATDLVPTSDLIVSQGGLKIVDTTRLLLSAVLALEKTRIPDVCASFQYTLSKAMASIAKETARRTGIMRIGVTGGVAVNARIVAAVRREVEKDGFEFLQHRLLPPGDGGLSLGQAVVASQV